MACGGRRALWRHGVSYGEWHVACHGDVWSAGRVATEWLDACGVRRHGVMCGVTV